MPISLFSVLFEYAPAMIDLSSQRRGPSNESARPKEKKLVAAAAAARRPRFTVAAFC
jgi:hypothetical protein